MTGPADSSNRRSRLASVLRPRMVSVRTRIVAAITATMALGLLAVGGAVYFVERQSTLDQMDERLRANLDTTRFIVAEGEALASDSPERQPWSTPTAALRSVVERMSADDNTGVMGMVANEINMVPGVRLDVDLSGADVFAEYIQEQTAAGEPVIGTYVDDDLAWRYLAAPIVVESSTGDDPAVFVMVYDIHAELAEFEDTARVFVIASLIALVLVAAVGGIVATRLLRPLRQMREIATRVSARSLDERIPVVGNDDVADLARTMNAMLDRLDAALDSQRRLLSDVGHELKTPITIVHGHIEVMDPTDVEDVRATQALTLDELERMGRLVQDLSDAASLHGSSPVTPTSVDLADLLDQIARKAQGITGAEISVGARSRGTAMIDAARVTQAMLQLAQNAVAYGGGRIVLGSRLTGRHVELWVRDFGPGVPDEDKDEIFERFRRAATSDGVNGSGLGLNIVRLIAHAHGGSVRVDDAAGGGALFTIRLPRGPVDEAQIDREATPAGVEPAEKE
ncbi:HAMP domain-containing histidine kinase [Microbacterium esteraromaticum]|uniref:sensor histidine kinase n=1 Tax=Microbacterium esteraromaticum TaxID=57043 RepID=UPI001CD80003|nr:HAMP domain-containing sensor histidine kinase [Microbacterium esteraromaticum]MCA1306186.1 HAMP domain-containing histidine kinase [Microbacterium esteraromaticum]